MQIRSARSADAHGDLHGVIAVHICPFFERDGACRIAALVVMVRSTPPQHRARPAASSSVHLSDNVYPALLADATAPAVDIAEAD